VMVFAYLRKAIFSSVFLSGCAYVFSHSFVHAGPVSTRQESGRMAKCCPAWFGTGGISFNFNVARDEGKHSKDSGFAFPL
jgi:hypothetical protein